LQSTSAKPDGFRVHLSAREVGKGPMTRVEEASREKRLFRLEKDEGSGPEREVRESCTKTRERGRDEMVKAKFVLLYSCKMLMLDSAERERGNGDAMSEIKLLDGSLSDDTRRGVVSLASWQWTPYQSQWCVELEPQFVALIHADGVVAW